jgi:hypothetical protein
MKDHGIDEYCKKHNEKWIEDFLNKFNDPYYLPPWLLNKILKEKDPKYTTLDELKNELLKLGNEKGVEEVIEHLFTLGLDDRRSLVNQAKDSVYWKEEITFFEARKLFKKSQEGTVVLVNPELGVIKTGKQAVDEANLKQDPAYTELIAQAKFYNGALNNYTAEEQESLAKWVKEKGASRVFALLQNILRIRPEDRDTYEGSVLQKLIESASR